MAVSFRYTGLYVADVLATVAFYERAFGLRLRYMHPSNGYAELETGDTLLAFVGEAFIEKAKLLGEVRFRPSRPDDTPPAAQPAFVSDDLDRDWQRAVAAGCAIVKEPEAKPWGQTAGYLRDLNGVIIEITTRSPRDSARKPG